MAILIGTPVRFRPEYAKRRGVSPGDTFSLRAVYREPGQPAVWAVVGGLPPGQNRVKLRASLIREILANAGWVAVAD